MDSIRPTMCKNCSCLGVLGKLVKYHRGEKLTDKEKLIVRDIIEGRGEYIDKDGKDDLFRCYMDADDSIKCRGLKIAFDYIDRHHLKWT